MYMDSKKFSAGQYSEIANAMSNIEGRKFNKLGTLIIGEVINCQHMPKTCEELKDVMMKTADMMKVTVVSSTFHAFNPHGLSGVLVLAESHYSIHTWPEHKTIAIDLFCCGVIDYEIGIQKLIEFFKASDCQILSLPRLTKK